MTRDQQRHHFIAYLLLIHPFTRLLVTR